MSILDLSYDDEYDYLYIKISDNSDSYEAEKVGNISIFRDFSSDDITGFIIFGFYEKIKTNSLPSFPYNMPIDYLTDIIPKIKSNEHIMETFLSTCKF